MYTFVELPRRSRPGSYRFPRPGRRPARTARTPPARRGEARPPRPSPPVRRRPRPLTMRMWPDSGSRPARRAQPVHLVHRVVPATSSRSTASDPIRSEQPGRVQAAGAGEHPLRLPQPVPAGRRDGGDLRLVGGQVVAGADPDGVDALLAADPAGAGGEEVPLGPLLGHLLGPPRVGGPLHLGRRRQVSQLQGRVGHVLVAHPDLPQVDRETAALGQQEPGGQVDVVTGVRMVTVSGWPPIRISSGSSTASRSARAPAHGPAEPVAGSSETAIRSWMRRRWVLVLTSRC